jgi:hypothetical protein
MLQYSRVGGELFPEDHTHRNRSIEAPGFEDSRARAVEEIGICAVMCFLSELRAFCC